MENPLVVGQEVETRFENSIINDQLVDKSFLNHNLNDKSNPDINQILSLSELIQSELNEKES
jgi:hypothetical protein